MKIKKSFTLPLVALSVFAGGLHGYLTYESSRVTSPSSPVRTPFPPAPPKKTSPKATHPPRPTPPKPLQTSSPVFSEAPENPLAQLEELAKKANFSQAEKQALLFSQQEKDFQNLHKLFAICHSLTRSFPRERLQRKKLLLTFPKGGQILALELKENYFLPIALLTPSLPKSITLEQPFFLSASQAEPQPLTQEEWETLLLQWIENKLSNAESFMPYYQLAFSCAQNGAQRFVFPLLCKALGKEGGSLLLEAFASHPRYSKEEILQFYRELKPLFQKFDGWRIQLAQWKKLPPQSSQPPPSPQVVVEEKEEAQKQEEGKKETPRQELPPVAQKKEAPLPKKWQTKLAKAKRELQKGLTYYQKIYRANPRKRAHLIQQAVLHLQKAKELYEQIAKQFPQKEEFQKTLQQIQQLLYDCLKSQGF